MRALIERRLAAPRPPADPYERLLARVVGEVTAELRAALAAESRHAAVLLALVERQDAYNILFTERAPGLKSHPGQISFPGGRVEEPGETAVEAALREAHEEIGLEPRHVSVAGCLDAHVTGTGFSVTPVVGFVPNAFVARPHLAEVSGVFEVPLAFFLDPKAARETHRERFGCRFRSYEFHYGGRLIWGATAAMLVNFRDILTYET